MSVLFIVVVCHPFLQCCAQHDMSLLDEDTYEMCYNTACYLIGGKEFMKALEKLKNAEGKC